jgi:hypothetical protein
MDADLGSLGLDLSDARAHRGAVIAATSRLRRKGDVWTVPSQSGKRDYKVNVQDGTCECADFAELPKLCKHRLGVLFTILRETDGPSGRRLVIEALKTRPKAKFVDTRDPVVENVVAEHLKLALLKLARSLFLLAPEPVRRIDQKTGALQRRGRPRIPIADVLTIALAMQVYRRPWKQLKEVLLRLQEAKLIAVGPDGKLPHPNSIARWIEDKRLTAVILEILRYSALVLLARGMDGRTEFEVEDVAKVPLHAKDEAKDLSEEFEKTYAIDGSGLATTRGSNWFGKRLDDFAKKAEADAVKEAREEAEARGERLPQIKKIVAKARKAAKKAMKTALRGHKVYVKLHLCIHVRTRAIMAAHVTRGFGSGSSDQANYEKLMEQTNELAAIRRMLVDKIYQTHDNVEATARIGADFYSIPKTRSVGQGDGPVSWIDFLERYYADPEKFTEVYHGRSTVEHVFGSMWANFGNVLASQWFVGQTNETLLKCVGFNLLRVLKSLANFPELWGLIPGFEAALKASETRVRRKRAPRRKRRF